MAREGLEKELPRGSWAGNMVLVKKGVKVMVRV